MKNLGKILTLFLGLSAAPLASAANSDGDQSLIKFFLNYIFDGSFYISTPPSLSMVDTKESSFNIAVTKIPGGAKNTKYGCGFHKFEMANTAPRSGLFSFLFNQSRGVRLGCPDFLSVRESDGLVSLNPDGDAGTYEVYFLASTMTGKHKKYAYSKTSLTVATPAACGSVAHGTSTSRTRYAATAVAWNEICQSQTQTATCDNGSLVFSPNNYASLTCSPAVPRACGSVAHDAYATRIRYAVSQVAFEAPEPAREEQMALCVDGTLEQWSGSYIYESFTRLPGVACPGGLASGQTVTRTRFASASVAWDKTCQSEVQTGTCNNGILVFSPNNYASLTCSVTPPRDCEGGIEHNAYASRPAFSSASVPSGSTCDSVATTQSALCQNGKLAEWAPSAFGSCVVEAAPGISCGDLQSGQVKKELFYTAESVEYPATCEKGVKLTSCSNGVLSASGPSFEACVVTGATASSSIFLDLVNPEGDYSPMEVYVQVKCGDEGNRVLQMAVTNAPNGLVYLQDEESRSCDQWAEKFTYDWPYIETMSLMMSGVQVQRGVTKIGFVENGVVVVEALVGGVSGPARPSPTEENLKLFTAEPIGLAWKDACIKDSEGQCDLSGVDLSNRDLRGTDLRDVKFTGCSASNADFSGLDLSGSYFSGCNLSGSLFIQSNLTGTNLTNANMEGVNLSEANLLGAFLSYSNLTGAIGLGSDSLSSSEAGSHINLGGLDLSGLSWDSRFIMENNFANANLEGASFQGSYMRFTNFEGANLTDANFSNSYESNWLWQINFTNANLTRAKFIDSYLLDVNFNGANLTDAEFSGQYYQGVDGVPGSTRHVVVYFQNTNMTRVKFLNRQVLYGDFTGANLNCADFSGSTFDGSTEVPYAGLARCEENSVGGGTDCRSPGTFDTGTSCELAPLNFYAVLGSTEPTACPAGRITSGIGSDGIEDCFCPAGSYDPDGNSCTVSPENTYSPLGATSPTECPVNFVSPVGSDASNDCRNTVKTIYNNLSFSSSNWASGGSGGPGGFPGGPGGYGGPGGGGGVQLFVGGVAGTCDGIEEGINFNKAQLVSLDGETVMAETGLWEVVCNGGVFRMLVSPFTDDQTKIGFPLATSSELRTALLRLVNDDGLLIMQSEAAVNIPAYL
jgi:uncharacterized protein YjbI with pentapeptide repeats